MIRQATVNGTVITDDDLRQALSELAVSQGITERAAHEMVLSRVSDPQDMQAWISAIAEMVTELPATPQARRLARAGLTPDDLAQFSRSHDEDSEPVGLSADEAHLEVARLVNQNQSQPRPFLDVRKSAARAIRPPDNVAMTHQSQRLHDDSSELQLSASQRSETTDLDSYILKLSRGGKQGQRAFGLSQGVPDLTDTLDIGAPSESDLAQEAVQVPQGDSGDPFAISQKAADELDGLPSAVQLGIHKLLNAANTALAAGNSYLSTDRLRAAADVARGSGCGRLPAEIDQHVRTISTGSASYVPDPDEAQQQSAGTMSAAAVAAEVERLSSLAVAWSSNRSDPPKSLAQRNAEQNAARPGYSNGPQAPIRV